MLDRISELNSKTFENFGDPEINTRIQQYELAYRMQTSVPELMDLSGERRLMSILSAAKCPFRRASQLHHRLLQAW